MGLVVYILNEYRIDTKQGNNKGLKHVTVLEEAHNLLKNTTSLDSNLIGKSVEMLTNTIAEIRTYGEGFIIVDQSPSSVDIAAIKNTNTKIVLRTPEANDREAIGRSIGLTTDQVNEIAKLPSGVAVVYQNDWVSPVLTMINKANIEEKEFRYKNNSVIKPIKEARSEIVAMLLQPWIQREYIRRKKLIQDLKSLEIKRDIRKFIEKSIEDYVFLNGKLLWKTNEIKKLQKVLKAILDIKESGFDNILLRGNPDELRRTIKCKIIGFNEHEIDEICNILTKVGE